MCDAAAPNRRRAPIPLRDGETANTKFCAECGTPTAAAQPKAHFCTSCGNKLEPGQKFCPGCGGKAG